MRDKGFAAIGNIDRNLSLGFGSLVLILFVLYSLTESAFFAQVVADSNQRLTKTITSIVADSVNRVSFSGKYHSQLLVEQICKDNPNIDFIMLVDLEGRVFVHNDSSQVEQPLDGERQSVARQVLRENRTIFREIRNGMRSLIEVSMPYVAGFQNRVTGVIIVGVSTAQTEHELVRIRTLLYRLVVLLTLFGLIAAYFLSRLFARPVRALALQLKGLLEHVPLLISIVNRKGKLIEASRSFDQASPPQQKVMEDQGIMMFDRRDAGDRELVISEGGKEAVFLTSSFPLQKPGVEAVDQICTIAMDITRHKQAERKLLVSETRYRALVNNIPGAVYRCANDAVWSVEVISPEIEKISGYPPSDFIGNHVRSYASIVHPEDLDLVTREVLKGVEGRKPYVIEYRIIHADGAIRWISEKGQAVFSDEGLVQCLDGVILDITSAKKAEEALRQSQKMDAIGRLAGGVAHDLNNLLTPILGYAELLRHDKGLTQEHLDSLTQILQASTRARDIVKQLLAFGRKQLLQFRPIDLNTVITGFHRLLRRTIREDIEIEMNLGNPLPPVKADPGQIEQVLMNLALNAQDAMSGGGSMKIVTRLAETIGGSGEASAMVQLSVIDSGSGMNAEVLGQLFTPFFTTKPKDRGTGLGLATVYGIIKQHGGTVRVESSPGKGSVFTIDLPAAGTVISDETVPAPDRKIPAGSGTIMVVEDDEMVRTLAVRILEHGGYTVLQAARGSECLKILSESSAIDLLLTDVVMPEMNGMVLYEQVKIRFPQIRVLFMSGHTQDLIGEQGILDKDIPFIQKPFNVKDLNEKVREILEKRVRPTTGS